MLITYLPLYGVTVLLFSLLNRELTLVLKLRAASRIDWYSVVMLFSKSNTSTINPGLFDLTLFLAASLNFALVSSETILPNIGLLAPIRLSLIALRTSRE